MERFINELDDNLVEESVKELMLSSGFRRTIVAAIEQVGCDNYTVNSADAELSKVTPEKVIRVMEKEGFSLIEEKGIIRFQHRIEFDDGVDFEDVAYHFLDVLDRYSEIELQRGR